MNTVFKLLLLTLTCYYVNGQACVFHEGILSCRRATTDDIYKAVRINSEEILSIFIYDNTNFTDARITRDLFNVPELINLQILTVQDTNLESVENNAFEHLPRLYDINLDHSHLEKVSGQTFSGLANSMSKLTMFDNRLTEIDCSIFDTMPKLYELQFSMNGVSEYTCSSKQLNYLNLGSNRFTTLDVDSIVQKNPKLKTLLIQYNHFSCNDLTVIINKLKARSIQYVLDNQRETNVPNVDGVVCYNH